MAKLRVYELAKELGLESKALIRFLQSLGVEVHSHMSTLEDDAVEKVKQRHLGKRGNPGPDKTSEQKGAQSPTKPQEKGHTSMNDRQQERQGQDHRPQGDRRHEHRPQGNQSNYNRSHGGQGGQGQGGYNRGPGQGGQGQGQGGYNRGPGQGGQGQGGYNRGPGQGGQGQGQGGYNRGPGQGGQGQGGYNRGPGQGGQGQGQGGYNRGPGQGGQGQGGYNRGPGQGGQGQGGYNRGPGQGGQGQGGYNRGPGQGGQGQGGYNRGPGQGGQGQGGYNRGPGQGGQGQGGYNRGPGQGGQGQGGYNRGPGQGGQGQGGYNRGPGQGGYNRGPGQGGQGGRPDNRSGFGGPRNDRPADGAKPAAAVTKEQPKDLINRTKKKQDGADAFARQRKEKEELVLLEKTKGRNKKRRDKKDKQDVEVTKITIGEVITVQELASIMNKPATELIKKLILLGIMAAINQEIDFETAELLANDFGIEVEKEKPESEEDLIPEFEDKPEDVKTRPSVVTVMGHVDHGKTSLLDAIRSTNVIATEAGGITQHIGAYQVSHNGKRITFLDTPGHEAFTAMRARGAQVTDIAILVVAADDGVMPQTIEAINHAKAAGVPIIVAINKIDKPDATPDRVKQELTEHGLVAEEWGGDAIMVPVSAKMGQGIEDLLEMILLVAEVAELKANAERPAEGVVIEAELDKGRGPVATILVQNGTLNVGDILVAGAAHGRVRAMIDDKGRRVKKAPPSTPVEVLGLHEVPRAGDTINAVPDEKLAREIAERRNVRRREEEMTSTARVSLEDLFKQIKEGEVKDLKIIIKGDVQGSVEAIKQSLLKLSTDEVRVMPIHGGVGAITETDIMLAAASNAIVLGFNVRPDVNAKRLAESEKVDMRLYRVIYDAIEDVKAAMSGLLEPDLKEVQLGTAQIRQIFKVSKVGTIAGCMVTDGKILRDAKVRIVRDGIVIHEGKLDTLKRFKDDAKEVAQGYECGLTIDNFNDLKEGDVLEAYTFEEIKREIK